MYNAYIVLRYESLDRGSYPQHEERPYDAFALFNGSFATTDKRFYTLRQVIILTLLNHRFDYAAT